MPKRGKKHRSPPTTHRDELYDAVRDHLPFAAQVYAMYEDDRPVLLYDLQEQRLYVYPYEPFKVDLTLSSQASLAEQYEQALKGDCFVLFVRDNVARKLVSYSLPRQ